MTNIPASKIPALQFSFLRSVIRALLIPLLAASALLGMAEGAEPQVRFARQIDWIGHGHWLKLDAHIHTRFSDGRHTVAEVAEKAIEFGCDVIAITDHASLDRAAAIPEYAEAIEAARREYPKLIILAGLEWNVPPWNGEEHATVLAPPGPHEWDTLQQFMMRFDDWRTGWGDPAVADEALRWLAQQTNLRGTAPLVFYNHPSRKRDESMSLVADFVRWREVNDLMIGFSGSPGHQDHEALGAYQGPVQLIDRWDPVAARVGDAWDTLLQKGLDVWAARADSDFHNTRGDYWPGQFSETWLYAPERSAEGALQALRAGAFFAAHGHIVRQVELRVDAPGLPRPASSGEVIEAPPGTSLTVSLDFNAPATDWEHRANQIDEIELIAVTSEGADVVARRPPENMGPALTQEVLVPTGELVLRARGRRVIHDGPDLMFYTNPIRIRSTSALAAASEDRGKAEQAGQPIRSRTLSDLVLMFAAVWVTAVLCVSIVLAFASNLKARRPVPDSSTAPPASRPALTAWITPAWLLPGVAIMWAGVWLADSTYEEKPANRAGDTPTAPRLDDSRRIYANRLVDPPITPSDDESPRSDTQRTENAIVPAPSESDRPSASVSKEPNAESERLWDLLLEGDGNDWHATSEEDKLRLGKLAVTWFRWEEPPEDEPAEWGRCYRDELDAFFSKQDEAAAGEIKIRDALPVIHGVIFGEEFRQED